LTYTDELPPGAENNVNRASGCGNRDNSLSFCVLMFTAITNSNIALGTFFSHYNKSKVKQVQVMMVNADKAK
jgi:CRISPR/Cas system type I-B associated protein Csh2 (Cas7 group RAMP superfamily)